MGDWKEQATGIDAPNFFTELKLLVIGLLKLEPHVAKSCSSSLSLSGEAIEASSWRSPPCLQPVSPSPARGLPSRALLPRSFYAREV
jgi:hypothetical protein